VTISLADIDRADGIETPQLRLDHPGAIAQPSRISMLSCVVLGAIARDAI